jgi:spermidine synthase
MNKKVLYTLNDDLRVVDYVDKNGENIREIASDDMVYSTTYVGDKKYEIYHSYHKLYDLPVQLNPETEYALVLGGGCFTYPKYYIYKYPQKFMDSVEIDREIIDVSFKYFFVDDLYKECNLAKDRLKIYCEDAYEFVENCNKKYDYIFLDVFDYIEPVEKFLDEKFIKKAYNLLSNESSIFAVNYILNEGKEQKFDKFLDVLKNQFKYTYLLTVDNKNVFDGKYGNMYLINSNKKLDIQSNDAYILLDYERIKK